MNGREDFVRFELVDFAYPNSLLLIDEEQTMSQPYTVALTLEAFDLSPTNTLLDSGSGYAAAGQVVLFAKQ